MFGGEVCAKCGVHTGSGAETNIPSVCGKDRAKGRDDQG